MRAWMYRSICSIALVASLASPAFAQLTTHGYDAPPSAPCAGHPLQCINTQASAGLAINGVVRVYAVYLYDSGPGAGTNAAGCGTGFFIPNQYSFGPQLMNTFVTARHVLEGNDANGHYRAIQVQLEFFYVPLGRACGVLANNECHIFPGDCSTPTILNAPCWDWDTQCDIGRIFLSVGSTPAAAGAIPLGANPVVGQVCWIPQHPQGRCMEWDEGPVTTAPAGCDFQYTISTQGGSSGAPVIYQDRVVGVHNSANVDGLGNPICPNNAAYVSQLVRFLGVAPTICQPTSMIRTSWGHLKTIFR